VSNEKVVKGVRVVDVIEGVKVVKGVEVIDGDIFYYFQRI